MSFLFIMSVLQILRKVIQSQSKQNVSDINVGDIIQIKILIKEGNKERLQQYEGVVISKKFGNIITVRRIFQNIGIEYVFSLFTPQVVSLIIKKRSKVRRAKLFYLRNRIGKRAQLKNKLSLVSI
jgi:large subunit ribosomal protein L19